MLKSISLTLILLFSGSLRAADALATAEGRSPTVAPTAFLAVLENGFSIPHYRRERFGSQIRLYISPAGDSFVDVPASSIVGIETEDEGQSVPLAEAPSLHEFSVPLLDELVSRASDRHGIDPDLIRSVIAAESGFNPGAVSPKGAQGLMQLMPETASSLGVRNALDPERNVDGGTRYLRQLLLLYKGDLVKALAAYNAGPQRVEQYHGVPPYPETRAYVSRIIRDFNRKKMQEKTAKSAGSN
jgi:hypothetical protein